MAAITQATSGNWSNTATWTGGVVPGAGDTVTLHFDITVDTNVTVGSSPNTGGTAAITMSYTSHSPIVFTVNAGKTLTLEGDLILSVSANFNFGAGCQLVFKPPSGQQYFVTHNYANVYFSFAGTSGSHCTVKTDTSLGGLNVCFVPYAARSCDLCMTSATYTDFTNIGTTTQTGVFMLADWPSINSPMSITNCTFTGCNFRFWFGPDHVWDGTFLCQNVSVTSSVLITLAGRASCCGEFDFGNAVTSGSRLVDQCAFDSHIACNPLIDCVVSNCIIQGHLYGGGGQTWPTDAYFYNNLLITVGNPIMVAYGPVKNSYFYDTDSSGSHYLITDNSVAAMTVTGLVFDTVATDGKGDVVFPQSSTSGTPTLSVTNCIVLPAGTATAGKLVSNNQGASATCKVTAEHNTYYAGSTGSDGNSGVIAMGEAADYVGMITSCRANLTWAESVGTQGFACDDGLGTPVVDAVTLAGYNGFWNPNTSTCYYNTSTSQAGVVGYNKLKVSNASPYPNSQIGTGDFTANPTFVDSTRNLASWGGTTAGGGTATVAGAVATIAANPSLIGQASTGLLAWVRAGFRPTNAAYEATSYPGDASTADAAGTSWPGGAPGVGAMAFAGAGPGFTPWIYGDQIQEMFG